MKQNIAKVLTFSLLATSAVFISCVDNEKNLFDAEQLRQIYEETFPVKNIDPDGDWTMSRSVTAHVTVNGDLGEDYPIRIFDANPLSPESNAKLLAEGVANRSTSFNVVMDCATALDRVFVARVDRKGHYLVQPIAIENEEVKHFLMIGALGIGIVFLLLQILENRDLLIVDVFPHSHLRLLDVAQGQCL